MTISREYKTPKAEENHYFFLASSLLADSVMVVGEEAPSRTGISASGAEQLVIFTCQKE